MHMGDCHHIIGKDHGQQYHHTGLLFQFQIFNIHHGSITNCVKPKSASNGTSFTSNFMKIYSAIPELLYADRQTKEGTLHGRCKRA
jgi:hypothetical protein